MTECHLTLMFQSRAPCKTIYGHAKSCVWKEIFLLGPISLKHDVPMYARLGQKLVIEQKILTEKIRSECSSCRV